MPTACRLSPQGGRLSHFPPHLLSVLESNIITRKSPLAICSSMAVHTRNGIFPHSVFVNDRSSSAIFNYPRTEAIYLQFFSSSPRYTTYGSHSISCGARSTSPLPKCFKIYGTLCHSRLVLFHGSRFLLLMKTYCFRILRLSPKVAFINRESFQVDRTIWLQRQVAKKLHHSK